MSSVTFSGPSTARRPLSQRRPQLRLPRLQLGRQQLGTVPPEVRVAAVALGVPLVGEAAARDVPEQLPHRGGQVVVIDNKDALDSGHQPAPKPGRGDMIDYLRGTADHLAGIMGDGDPEDADDLVLDAVETAEVVRKLREIADELAEESAS